MTDMESLAFFVMDGYIRKKTFERLKEGHSTPSYIAKDIGHHKKGARRSIDSSCRSTHISSVSRALKQLKEKELVEMAPSNIKRLRNKFYMLTEKGREVSKKIDDIEKIKKA